MRKSISTQELKSKVGEIVSQQGDQDIIESDQKFQDDEARYIENSKRLGEIMERAAARNKDIPSGVLEKVISQAIAEVREERRRKRVTA